MTPQSKVRAEMEQCSVVVLHCEASPTPASTVQTLQHSSYYLFDNMIRRLNQTCLANESGGCPCRQAGITLMVAGQWTQQSAMPRVGTQAFAAGKPVLHRLDESGADGVVFPGRTAWRGVASSPTERYMLKAG